MKPILLLILIFLIATLTLHAQNRDHIPFAPRISGHVHGWLDLSPAVMGPNALPVPEVGHGRVGETLDLEFGIHGHTMKGDQDVNSFVRIYYPLVGGLIAVTAYDYPTETFRMSNALRDHRQIYYDDTGVITQTGDLYFGTEVQLVRDRKYMPDCSLNFTIRTTTGNLDHVRYTDSPGYYAHLSFGKEIHLSGFVNKVGIYGMGGIYSWQTNLEELKTAQGPLYGVEGRFGHKNISWSQSLSGYYGQLNNGEDKPLVYKSKLIKSGSKADWGVEYQYGIRNYPYQTLRFSVVFHYPVRFKLQ